jgi:hypothetical protein
MHVCTVSIVPTRLRSLSSVTEAENCAESATIVRPHTMPIATMIHAGPPNAKPITSAQAPLTANEPMVTAVRPMRSAAQPPTRHPKAPLATTRNVTTPALIGGASP